MNTKEILSNMKDKLTDDLEELDKKLGYFNDPLCTFYYGKIDYIRETIFYITSIMDTISE